MRTLLIFCVLICNEIRLLNYSAVAELLLQLCLRNSKETLAGMYTTVDMRFW